MSDPEKKPVRTGDQETDEILNEMEDEGIETGIPAKSQKAPKKEGGSDADQEEEEEESTDESETEDKESEEESADDETSEEEEESDESEEEESEEEEEEEDESESEGEEEEGDDVESRHPRTGRSAPSWKMIRQLRRDIKNLGEAIKTIAKSDSATGDKKDEIDAEIKKFAEDNNLNESVASGLVKIAVKHAQGSVPKDLAPVITELMTRQKEQNFWNDQDKRFTQEFNRTILPLIRRDNPDAKQEDVQRIYDVLNGDANNPASAWHTKNAKKSLVQLYLSNPNLKPRGERGRTTGEETTPSHTQGKKDQNFEDLEPEDIDKMSDKEFDEFSDKVGKNKGGLVRKTL